MLRWLPHRENPLKNQILSRLLCRTRVTLERLIRLPAMQIERFPQWVTPNPLCPSYKVPNCDEAHGADFTMLQSQTSTCLKAQLETPHQYEPAQCGLEATLLWSTTGLGTSCPAPVRAARFPQKIIGMMLGEEKQVHLPSCSGNVGPGWQHSGLGCLGKALGEGCTVLVPAGSLSVFHFYKH